MTKEKKTTLEINLSNIIKEYDNQNNQNLDEIDYQILAVNTMERIKEIISDCEQCKVSNQWLVYDVITKSVSCIICGYNKTERGYNI